MIFDIGYDAVSIDAVASASHLSKRTIYRHFGDKAGLFEQVIRDHTDRIGRGMPVLVIEGGTADALREGLIQFGHRFLALVTRPELIAAEPVLLRELARHAEMPDRFLAAGPLRLREQLAASLTLADRSGLIALRGDTPVEAAEDLLSLLQGLLSLQVRLAPSMAGLHELERRATRAVDVFLRAYASRGVVPGP